MKSPSHFARRYDTPVPAGPRARPSRSSSFFTTTRPPTLAPDHPRGRNLCSSLFCTFTAPQRVIPAKSWPSALPHATCTGKNCPLMANFAPPVNLRGRSIRSSIFTKKERELGCSLDHPPLAPWRLRIRLSRRLPLPTRELRAIRGWNLPCSPLLRRASALSIPALRPEPALRLAEGSSVPRQTPEPSLPRRRPDGLEYNYLP